MTAPRLSPPERPINQKQMAEVLGVSACTIANLCREKAIPFMLVGRCYRFFPSEVIAALKQKPDTRSITNFFSV